MDCDYRQEADAAYHVRLRTQEDADAFMLDLAGRINNQTQRTSDGHKSYHPAVWNAFGWDVDHDQLMKVYGISEPSETPTTEAKYSQPKFAVAFKHPITGLPDKNKISTSGIERHILTLRQQNKRCARLTLGHSKKVANHQASIRLFMAFYNFVRKHQTLKTTPAVACGLADHGWTPDELIGLLH